jgi:hypothetical protein
VLSRRAGDIDRDLAADYAEMVADGEKQVATRLTNLRLAVAFLLAGAAATLGAWLWADASRPKPPSVCRPAHVASPGENGPSKTAHAVWPPPRPGPPPPRDPGNACY